MSSEWAPLVASTHLAVYLDCPSPRSGTGPNPSRCWRADAQLAAAVQPTGLIYFGVDISLSALQAAHHQELAVSDGAHLPFHDESFDFVTSIGSLEHYLDMERGIHEMARVLKPGGQACVLVPNVFSLTWNVLRVWRTGDLADDDGQPIQRFATRKAWSRLIEDNGLQVFRVLGLGLMLARTT